MDTPTALSERRARSADGLRLSPSVASAPRQSAQDGEVQDGRWPNQTAHEPTQLPSLQLELKKSVAK